MRTATPLATCSTITARVESAASAEISSPRFIGPGCSTIACSGSRARRRASRPYRRVYSSGLGKNPPPALDIRSRWTRSIMMASGFSSARTSSRWYETRAGQAPTPTGSSVGGATRTTSAPRVWSRCTLDRATRLCRTSPTIATRSPARSRPVTSPGPARCRRSVYASSSACVGCWCIPSPALMTAPCVQPDVASVWGAPDAWCRMTTASAPIACSVSAVSLSDSPLDTLEPLAEKLMTSADSRLAAVSNEMRVRVESSKNRLTTVRPRSVGSFLISRAWVAAIEPAVSRMRTASATSRSAVDSRCFIGRLPR